MLWEAHLKSSPCSHTASPPLLCYLNVCYAPLCVTVCYLFLSTHHLAIVTRFAVRSPFLLSAGTFILLTMSRRTHSIHHSMGQASPCMRGAQLGQNGPVRVGSTSMKSLEHIYEELTALQKAMATSFRNLCLGNLNLIGAKCVFMESIGEGIDRG